MGCRLCAVAFLDLLSKWNHSLVAVPRPYSFDLAETNGINSLLFSEVKSFKVGGFFTSLTWKIFLRLEIFFSTYKFLVFLYNDSSFRHWLFMKIFVQHFGVNLFNIKSISSVSLSIIWVFYEMDFLSNMHSNGWRLSNRTKFESTQLSHFKCKFKSEYFFEILVTYLVFILYLYKRKKQKQRGTLRIRVYFSLENNKKIYEFFIVLQSGFYKSHWYEYNFVDLVELILKIYFLLQLDILFGKYRDFRILTLFSFFTKFFQIRNIPDWYIRL